MGRSNYLGREGERTQMEIRVWCAKNFSFPKKTLMKMGIVLWVILLFVVPLQFNSSYFHRNSMWVSLLNWNISVHVLGLLKLLINCFLLFFFWNYSENFLHLINFYFSLPRQQNKRNKKFLLKKTFFLLLLTIFHPRALFQL